MHQKIEIDFDFPLRDWKVYKRWLDTSFGNIWRLCLLLRIDYSKQFGQGRLSLFWEQHYLVLAGMKLYLCRKWVAFDLNSNVLRRNYIEEEMFRQERYRKGMSFHSWLPSEHRRRTQHIFKALPINVKSIILRPPFSLLLIRVDSLVFGFLYFHTKSKISLLTSVANVSGVFSTIHTNDFPHLQLYRSVDPHPQLH